MLSPTPDNWKINILLHENDLVLLPRSNRGLNREEPYFLAERRATNKML